MAEKKKLFTMFLPVFLEHLFASAINMANTIMVSNVGEYAVSATSMVGTINNVVNYFFIGVSTGAIVKISQYYGAKNNSKCEAVARQSILLSVAIGTVIALTMILFGRSIIDGLFGQAEQTIRSAAVTYMMLCAISEPFTALYSTANGIMYGVGDFKRTLRNSLSVGALSMGASAFFIYVCHLGIVGAALGIILSRVVFATLLYWELRNGKTFIKIRSALTRLEWSVVSSVLRVGIPSAVDNMIVQGSNVIVQRFVVSMGSAVIAANAIAGSISGLLVLLPGGVITMSVTVVGQCFGTGDMKKCRKNMLGMVGLGLGLAAVNSAVCLPFMNQIIGLYNPQAETFEIVKSAMIIMLVIHAFMWAPAWVTPAALRGCGDVQYSTVVSMIAMLAVKMPLVWLFGIYMNLGLVGMWLAVTVEWAVRIVLIFPRIFTKKWQRPDRI